MSTNTVEINQERFVAVGGMTGLRFSFTARGKYCCLKECILVINSFSRQVFYQLDICCEQYY